MLRQIAHVRPASARYRWPFGPSTDTGTGDEVIDHIAEGRHQHTEVIQGPPPGELSDHPQNRSGLGIDMAPLQQEEGLMVMSGQIQIMENALRLLGLECPELELPGS